MPPGAPEHLGDADEKRPIAWSRRYSADIVFHSPFIRGVQLALDPLSFTGSGGGSNLAADFPAVVATPSAGRIPKRVFWPESLRIAGVEKPGEAMMRVIRLALLTAAYLMSPVETALAQNVPGSGADNGWQITVYPLLAWVPLDIGIDVDIPPIDTSGGGSGKILDSRFDGAFFGGVTASKGSWRIEGYGLWAGFGGDRPERPFLTVDLDLIYGSGKLGRRVAPDLYVTGGVRRLALNYDITLGDLPGFSRKPGVWDPIVGIGWHRVRPKVEWHAAFDGGGFGVGADVDLGASFSVDWKPIPHFGLTGGYNLLYLKVTDSVASRDLTVKLTAHGPTVGFGLYF